MEPEEITIKCKICKKGILVKEDRKEQFNRIKSGISYLFPREKDERLDEFTKNYIGFGPNYIHKCDNCNILKKIIPDGRDRE